MWHIFQPEDTIKIRDFLNKIAIEKGLRLDPHDDPIHDQSTYLDMHLRKRLYNEYGVKGKKSRILNIKNLVKLQHGLIFKKLIQCCNFTKFLIYFRTRLYNEYRVKGK